MNQQYIDTKKSLEEFEGDSRTNYQKVVDWNNTFGIPVKNSPDTEIFNRDPKLVEYRMSLIREEMKELEEAIKKGDMNETVDALSDILVVVYGAGASFGINLDKSMHLVNDSNMSKSCISEQEAIETVEWYKKNEPRYDSPTYRKAEKGEYWIVYNESTQKILKCINWKTVNFSEFIKSME